MIRRLRGFCFYCGRPSRADVCRLCDDLPPRDPVYVDKAVRDQWKAVRK